ncbi:MAG: sigma-70 family RNA polymerase sigma factor [Clostridia bacterium]|nr:sigma-70 family RNA polymerase sigma factor [Clostridia bacterium]
MINDQAFERECEELLLYLYDLAVSKYQDHDDLDALIQDTILVYVVKRNEGEHIEYPKGFLSTVMKNKYNAYLRRKYRNRTVSFENFDVFNDEDLQKLGSEDVAAVNDGEDEYAAVRREIGRLIHIYREVTVRHYIHGHTVERIAKDLGISPGTVKSRLSSARSQIKEGIGNMEKYSSVSYEPKNVGIGIWGGDSMRGEPFTLLHSLIEGNILWLAYEKPISIREISDTMGMPTAYVEPLVDRLVTGELMGRTDGGLVYTRCYMEKYADTFGDIERQEALAEKYAETVWNAVWKHVKPLTEREQFASMSEKQKATMMLFIIDRCINQVALMSKPSPPPDWSEYPERPNGGRWWAILTVSEHDEKRDSKYIRSGPVHVGCSKNNDGNYDCKMYDLQSCFGEAHWGYDNMKCKVSLQSAVRFYASLVGCNVHVDNYVSDLIPDFEKLHILRRRDDGEIALDIPALTFEEARLWNDAMKKIREELFAIMGDEVKQLWNSWTHKIPMHVDGREHFLHDSAVKVFSVATMLAITEKKLMPYKVEVGKTPIIFVEYRKNEGN